MWLIKPYLNFQHGQQSMEAQQTAQIESVTLEGMRNEKSTRNGFRAEERNTSRTQKIIGNCVTKSSRNQHNNKNVQFMM